MKLMWEFFGTTHCAITFLTKSNPGSERRRTDGRGNDSGHSEMCLSKSRAATSCELLGEPAQERARCSKYCLASQIRPPGPRSCGDGWPACSRSAPGLTVS